MEFVGDFHIHTIASGDGFGTIKEVLTVANKRGFKGIAITDHGPKMAASSHYYYFESLISNVSEDEGIIIYPGAEANIIDEEGTLDLPQKTLNRLEFIIASFHTFSWTDMGPEINTRALKSCLLRYNVRCIAHLNSPHFDIDIDEIIPVMLEKKVTIELNSRALKKDKANWGAFKNIVLKCKEKGIKFLVASDAHYPEQVGDFKDALEFMEYCGLNEDDILNTSWEKVTDFFSLRSGCRR
jgi:Histidinol phosphatase and related hydrolases of the PHP family